MNLIPMIAKELGVEVGEVFKLKQTSGNIKSAKYRFRNIGDQIIYGQINTAVTVSAPKPKQKSINTKYTKN